MTKQQVIIIGAGPAGLTAAYELLDKTDVHPYVAEMSGEIGGISRTARYKGNRIDIGGHRFFSKSDVVMQWWQNILPMQGAPAIDDRQLGREVPVATQVTQRDIAATPVTSLAPDPEVADAVMLVRNRLSRIYFLRKFFDYPISLSKKTIVNLGLTRIMKIGFSYLRASAFPRKPVKSLEDYLVNQFGVELYQTFFRDYTEKVWGVPCNEIKPEWGAQRIKGLSLSKTVLHALKSVFSHKSDIDQKKTETSLIELFLYPKFGPGQLWETVAGKVQQHGGEIAMQQRAVGVRTQGNRITGIEFENAISGARELREADYYISTMPVRELIVAMGDIVPPEVKAVAQGLCYRDFTTVGLLVNKLAINNTTSTKTVNNIIPDNWIYIQEPDVKLGRIQIFNNWSPYLVADPGKVWIGLEYFCREGDELWRQSDADYTRFAVSELAKIGIVDPAEVLDSVVIRVPKAYPAYFGTYDDFGVIRDYLNQFENLFLIGRNGMHRYNNMDHSMLSAMTVVDNIRQGVLGKDNIWAVNTEEEYHESK